MATFRMECEGSFSPHHPQPQIPNTETSAKSFSPPARVGKPKISSDQTKPIKVSYTM